MHKLYAVIAVIMGGLGVALGAFGAHGLQKLTADPLIIHSYQTGVEYQQFQAVAILGVSLIYPYCNAVLTRWAARLMITGTILFSGSLYLITLLKINESSGVKIAGPITPLGGLLMIAGWFLLVPAILKKK